MTFNKLLNRLKKNKSWRVISALSLILLAGALIEAMSLLQYNYTHRLMEEELDYRTESELTLKSVRVKSMLKSNENMVRNYLWPIQRQIDQPDHIYDIQHRLVSSNDDVMSSFVAFVPGYYPDRERLFEPCAIRRGDSIALVQLAGESHDYTQREFYEQAVLNNKSSWSDPYLDADASGKVVTTYSMPFKDDSGKIVGVFGIDLSTQGIIDTLNTKHNYPSTFFLLLTEDGKLISQPDSSHTQQSDVTAVVEMINDSTYERKLSSTGRSKIITFTDKENGKGYAYYAFMRGEPHWQVVMVCYDNEVFGKLKKMRHNLLWMLLAGFSLLGFILYQSNKYVRRLHISRVNQERTDSELRIAQNIQSEMLPSQDISRPDIEVSGKQITALEVGGDLYDYFIRDEKLYFCLGDVSGKGVPSSLVMAVVHSFFRSQAQRESNPANIMQVINEIAAEGNETNMFVTLFIGVLDLPTGRLRYCNAGHDAPLIIADGVKPLAVNANLPLGVFDDFKYSLQETQLPQEVTLLFYTDGLTETADVKHSLFGMQRIIDTCQECIEQGKIQPIALMDSLNEAAKRFANGAQQSDDLTMLAIHYHRRDEIPVLEEQITLGNDVHQVPELNNFVKTVAERLNLESSLTSQLMLAVEEAVVNVMNYAYSIGSKGNVNITAQGTEESIKFIITDEGKAFDPTQARETDTTLSAEDRPIGGLGILLVQALMDSINYERINGKNVLTLKKNYKQNNDKNE
ncbi:MAG: SpoIIE family protein phosphatase [Muribaculaceae bacterium]|nr:SpoIIE family protein phosphatase [Muribaculaceae bacterium]